MCNRVRRGLWDNNKPAKSGHEIKLSMASGSEEIAELLNKCVKNLATAPEALQKLRNETGNQISERLTMVKHPTELEERRKLFGFKPQSHTKPKFTWSVSSPSSVKRFKNGSGKVFITPKLPHNTKSEFCH